MGKSIKPKPRWPICIPSKGRYDSRLTIKLFERFGVPFRVFVEPQEYDLYAKHVPEEKLHKMPHSNKGLAFTRNYIWDLMADEGHEYYWTFDDNIRSIIRLHYNHKVRMVDAIALVILEDFALRYDNLVVSGMQYDYFAPRKAFMPPVVVNQRVYSNMLIKTFAKDRSGKPYRFKTFFNDDTDFCLRVLKDGYCTALFYAFLAEKESTMIISGGLVGYYRNTNERYEFADELRRAHPDVVTVVRRYGRWHHHVDYSPFQRQQLRLRPGVRIPDGVNEYGMELQERVGDKWLPFESTEAIKKRFEYTSDSIGSAGKWSDKDAR